MDKEIFQIPAILTKYESKSAGSLKLTFNTQDGVRADLLSTLISFKDNCGFLNFAVRKIDAMDLKNLPEIDPSLFDEKKSPSERLRNVIYCYFCQKEGIDIKGKKPDNFESRFREYYLKAMEKLINIYKDKLV